MRYDCPRGKSTSAESRAERNPDCENRRREGCSSFVSSTKATRVTGDTILGVGELRCFQCCRLQDVGREQGYREKASEPEGATATGQPQTTIGQVLVPVRKASYGGPAPHVMFSTANWEGAGEACLDHRTGA
jgi:hypothetical protein